MSRESEFENETTNEISSANNNGRQDNFANFSNIKNCARALFLQKKSNNLLNSEELQICNQIEYELFQHLWVLLDKSVSSETQSMDYSDFKRISSLLENEKMKEYFTASTFAKLQNGCTQGTVRIVTFFNYVMRKVWFQESRIALSLYDTEGQGYLTEDDLERYISEIIPTLTKLGNLDSKFYPFYLCIVVRKFFFFLDPYHTQRIKIIDILESGFLEDLLELRNENSRKGNEEANWFSYENALRFYAYYINLDENQNGMLSKDEFRRFGNGSLSELLVDRIFEEFLTYNGELDYKGFVDIMLMMENKKEPQSLHRYFKLLDIKQESFIDYFALKMFLKSLVEKLIEMEYDALNLDDIAVEVFDMIKPQETFKITLKDLINSGQGDIAVTILSDCNGFWCYENRELLFLNSQEEADV